MELLCFLALCHGCGRFSTWLALPGLRHWFPGLKKPAWHPPSWVFGKVWLVLYTLMAVAGWRLWRHDPGGLWLWGLQLIFNQLWTYLFFVRRSPGWALVDNFCLFLTLGIGLCVWERWAAWCMLAEWLWIGFAMTVNYATWKLNRNRS